MNYQFLVQSLRLEEIKELEDYQIDALNTDRSEITFEDVKQPSLP